MEKVEVLNHNLNHCSKNGRLHNTLVHFDVEIGHRKGCFTKIEDTQERRQADKDNGTSESFLVLQRMNNLASTNVVHRRPTNDVTILDVVEVTIV